MQILCPMLVETSNFCHVSVRDRKGFEQLRRMVRRCIHGQQWAVHSLIAHPSVWRPSLTFFHLPQKVSWVHTVLSMCFWNSWWGLIIVLKLLNRDFPEHPFCAWFEHRWLWKANSSWRELYLLSSKTISSKCYPRKHKHIGFVGPSNMVFWSALS